MPVVRHEELPVWIALNGVRRIVLSCSRHDAAALALGHLVAEGWVRSAADVRTLSIAHDDDRIGLGVLAEVETSLLDAHELVRRHQILHGCGLRHVLDCDPAGLTSVQSPRSIDTPPLLRILFAAAEELAPGGGMHAAALSDGSTLFAMSTDVARHCALDRAIGLGLQEHDDLSGAGIVCTARISGAMALKAVRARLGWIASRSIATSLAREIAAAYGVLLLERAGRPPREA